jgi:hypothetical protein
MHALSRIDTQLCDQVLAVLKDLGGVACVLTFTLTSMAS